MCRKGKIDNKTDIKLDKCHKCQKRIYMSIRFMYTRTRMSNLKRGELPYV